MNSSRNFSFGALLCISAVTVLSACGGGGSGGSSSSASSSSSAISSSSTSSSSSSAASSASSSSASSGVSLQQRIDAATQTAQNNNQCSAIHPFYWEIGDQAGMLVGATAGNGDTTPNAGTIMLIASASKLVFGAFVIQLHSGNLTANDIAALNMTTGYTNLAYTSCLRLLRMNQDAETVHQCFTSSNGVGNNNDFDANAVSKFFYNGAHFQWLADNDLNFNADNNAALQSAVSAQLGAGFNFSYDSPQLAAGVQTTAQDYAMFLRKILGGQLLIHDLLGTHTVCTNPLTCATALSTPVPTTESWHYSLGHWVEDDPVTGDGAFSSPGAKGFYPWIDSSKTYYGIVAREVSPLTTTDSIAVDSVYCGRTIRKAWMTGVAQ